MKNIVKAPASFEPLSCGAANDLTYCATLLGKKSLILTSVNYQRIIFVDTKNECTWYVNIYFKYVKVTKQIFFFVLSALCSFSYYNNNKLRGKHLIRT